MTRIGTWLVLFITFGATIGCDRVTKHVAAATLSGAPGKSFLADTVRLEYAENPGAFLGFGADWSLPVRLTLFGAGNALLLFVLALTAMRLRSSRPALLGLALVVGGGASNLLDRLAYGTVVDFINVGLGPLRTGIFNVADMAIMLGAAMVVASGVWSDRRLQTR